MDSTNTTDIESKIQDILNSDEGNYGYLFPYTNTVPKVDKHIFSTLDKSTKVDEFIIKKMLDIRYIGWTAKILLNVNLFPEQIHNLQLLWTHPFSMLIASRGGAKSFLLAVYAVLKCLLEPGTKVAIVGAGLRQAKLVFGYIENIWHSSPMLRSIVGGGQKGGPKQSVDLCYFRIGSSIINALPLGNGDKIRGFRANVVIADEFASIPEDVFDIVVRGFAASAKSPLEAAKYISMQKRLIEAGLSKNKLDQMMYDQLRSNQIIYSGTAYYAFNHFAKRYEMFKQIIRSRGDKNKIAEIFGSEYNIPNNFDYRDYVVIRLPYTHVQPGLMDAKMLANAKATLPKNIFLMEYGACARENTLVYTTTGTKKITDIRIGDIVLTHTGKYRSVIACKYRNYKGKIYKIDVGIDKPIEVTNDHLIWDGNLFVRADELQINQQIGVARVKDIETYDYDGIVYNLEVEKDHSYLAQGIFHHNCFVKDSNGIYPRSLIEACTCTPSLPIKTPDGDVIFSPLMKGVFGRRYVMGLDPAAERDNLAITILEIWPNHYRVLFSYAINKPEYEKR